jgi:hypothetical protein
MFRKTYDVFGTPVVIDYRREANPYQRERHVKPRVQKMRRRAAMRR